MLNRERNGEYLLKLVDFGISKRVTRDISERNVTVEGTVVGSPDYMPPEQLRAGDVDFRADIYATGVVLYEALTGRMPFDAPSLTELLAAILRDPIVAPTNLRADCPPELERIVLRAMSRNCGDRFESANEMANALSQVVMSQRLPEGLKAWNVESFPEAGSAAAMSTLGRTTAGGDYTIETERVRTIELQLPKKKAWPLIALGGAVAVVALVLFLTSGSEGPPPDSIAPPIAAATPSQPSFPQVEVDLDPPEPVTAEAALPEELVEPPSEPVAATEDAAESDREPTASSSRSKRVASHKRAEPREASLKASPSVASAPVVDVSALVSQASSAFVQGQLPKALSLYRQAVAAAPAHAAAWRGLGMTAMKMGRNTDAAKAFERYLKLAPTAPDAARIREKLSEL
jgi:serine/threonine-protein kinase